MSGSRPARRADAERNRAAIIEAAGAALADDPGTPTMHIARAAGVGRVTLYSHFPSRERLLRAVLDHVLAEADARLATIGVDGAEGTGADRRADAVLGQVLRVAWQNLNRLRRVRDAVLQELGPRQVRSAHDRIFRRVEQLIVQGQRQRLFRADLPAAWLASMLYALIHGAADEADAGRVPVETVPDLLVATALAALGAPDASQSGGGESVTVSGRPDL
jgi:AcrR family transcriptional regulator